MRFKGSWEKKHPTVLDFLFTVPKVLVDDLSHPKNNSVQAAPELVDVSCGWYRGCRSETRAWSGAGKVPKATAKSSAAICWPWRRCTHTHGL